VELPDPGPKARRVRQVHHRTLVEVLRSVLL